MRPGVLLGSVEVTEVIDFSEETWEQLRSEHLSDEHFDPRYIGWRLTNPRRVETPIQWRGTLGLFEVPDPIVATQLAHPLSLPKT